MFYRDIQSNYHLHLAQSHGKVLLTIQSRLVANILWTLHVSEPSIFLSSAQLTGSADLRACNFPDPA